jgi:hypothetical protein
MSGKAPPRGPRALVGSNPIVVTPQTTAPSSQHSSNSSPGSSSSPSIRRFGVIPPTGPRILTNGVSKPANATIALGAVRAETNQSANGHLSESPVDSTLGPNLNNINHNGQHSEGWSDSSAVSTGFARV